MNLPIQEDTERYSLLPETHNNMEPNYGSKGPYIVNLDSAERFDLLTGAVVYNKPKNTVVNDNPFTFIPQPVNNILDYPREQMESVAKDSMYLRNNTKPFETQLVGNADDPLLFRPLPKVSDELYVNPKEELRYTSVTPGFSAIENGPLTGAVAKNKVPRTFNNPAPNGFTTTGQVVCQTVRSEINNVPQARTETQDNNYFIASNTYNEEINTNTGPLKENRKPFTDFEYFGNSDPFNTPQAMNKNISVNVNTSLEKTQNNAGKYTSIASVSQPLNTKEYYNYQFKSALEQQQLNEGKRVGNTSAFNNQSLHMKNKENYTVNTLLEKQQLTQGKRVGNVNSFNSQGLHKKNYENFTMNTLLEEQQLAQGKRVGNTSSFNNQSLAMKNKDNYTMNTLLEKQQLLQGKRVGNVGAFNNQSLAMKNKENYTVNTLLEEQQMTQGKRVGNTSAFSGQSLAMKDKSNYQMNTLLEEQQMTQGKRVGNTSSFNNQSLHMKNKENYQAKTLLEKQQLKQGKRVGNTSVFNGQPLHVKNKENYKVKTLLEEQQLKQGKRAGNTSAFNSQSLHMKNKENYTMKTSLEQQQIIAGKNNVNASVNVPQRVRNFISTTVNKMKERLGKERFNAASAFNGQGLQENHEIIVKTINKEKKAPERMGGVNERFNNKIGVKSSRRNIRSRTAADEASISISVIEPPNNKVNERLSQKHRFVNKETKNNRLDPAITKPIVDNEYITTLLPL